MTEYPERSLPVLHFDEPLLEFACKQTTAHPKDGLFLYGPHSKPKKMREVRAGVIGTPAGINHFRNWASKIKQRIAVPPPGKAEKQDQLHLANFPGLEEAFGMTLNESEFVTYSLDPKAIDSVTRILNLHEAVSKVVKLYGVRPGVCYIGLVYKNLPNDPNDHACCAAQMFLSEGDGVVFRGANGPWKTGEI